MTITTPVTLEDREAALLAEWQKLQSERQQIDQHIERVKINVAQRTAAERAQAEREAAQQRKAAYDGYITDLKARFAELDATADDIREQLAQVEKMLAGASRQQKALVEEYYKLAVMAGSELWDSHREFADDGRQVIATAINNASALNMPAPKADFYTNAYTLNLSILETLRASGKVSPVVGITRRDNPSFWGNDGETQHLAGGQVVRTEKRTETPRIAQIAPQAINPPTVPQTPHGARPIEPDNSETTTTIRSGVESVLKSAPQPDPISLSVSAWLQQFTKPSEEGTQAARLYEAYTHAAQQAQVQPLGQRAFSNALIELGYSPERRRTGSFYQIELLP